MGLEKFIALKADNLIFDNSSKDLAQFKVVENYFVSSENDSKILVFLFFNILDWCDQITHLSIHLLNTYRFWVCKHLDNSITIANNFNNLFIVSYLSNPVVVWGCFPIWRGYDHRRGRILFWHLWIVWIVTKGHNFKTYFYCLVSLSIS